MLIHHFFKRYDVIKEKGGHVKYPAPYDLHQYFFADKMNRTACDISHVTLHEKDFRIVADFQIIAPQAIAASAELNSVHAELKTVESTLREKKDLKIKPAREGLRAQHESEFIISESATRYFKRYHISTHLGYERSP